MFVCFPDGITEGRLLRKKGLGVSHLAHPTREKNQEMCKFRD